MSTQPFNPQVNIAVAIDCAFVYAQNSGQMYTGTGIYMMDNQVTAGSTGEGSLELNTYVPAAIQFVGLNVYDIAGGVQGASVEITGLEYSSGTNVFTDNGWPSAQTAESSTCQWMGQALQSTSGKSAMTYQYKIAISYPDQPTKYYYWDPFMRCG